jgi:hypothetical protein
MRSWILRDLCDDNLLDAVERNHYENLFYLPSRHPQMQVVTLEDLIIIDSEIPSFHLNYVCTTKTLNNNCEKKLEKAKNFFECKNSKFSWIVGPNTSCDSVISCLNRLGYKQSEHLVSLLLNLNYYSKKLKYIPGFRVQHALTKATLIDIAKVYGNASKSHESLQNYFSKVSSLAFHQLDPIKYFVGYFKGEPVVAGELFLGAGLAGMRAVVVDSLGQQEKDFYFDVITKMILVAQQQGYHFATTTCAQSQRGYYEDLGFKKCCEFLKVT